MLQATWLLSFGLLAPLALVGIAASLAERRRVGVLVALLLASAASTAAFLVFARYRVPMLPLVVLFAVVGAGGVSSRSRARGRSAHAPRAPPWRSSELAAVAARFPRGDDGHPRAMGPRSATWARRSKARARPARAADAYPRGARGQPGLLEEAHVNPAAQALARGGDLEGAIREETEALRGNRRRRDRAHRPRERAVAGRAASTRAEAHLPGGAPPRP